METLVSCNTIYGFWGIFPVLLKSLSENLLHEVMCLCLSLAASVSVLLWCLCIKLNYADLFFCICMSSSLVPFVGEGVFSAMLASDTFAKIR